MTDSADSFDRVDFAIKRNLLKNAKEDLDRARARLEETSAKVKALVHELRAVCPHPDVTLCPGDADSGVTAVENQVIPQRFRIKTRRRCEVCGLNEQAGGRLDGATPARTMSQAEFVASDPFPHE